MCRRLLQDTAITTANNAMKLPPAWYGYGIREEWKYMNTKNWFILEPALWDLGNGFYINISRVDKIILPPWVKMTTLRISNTRITVLLTRFGTKGPIYKVTTAASFRNSPSTSRLRSTKEPSVNYGTLVYYLLGTAKQPISHFIFMVPCILTLY